MSTNLNPTRIANPATHGLTPRISLFPPLVIIHGHHLFLFVTSPSQQPSHFLSISIKTTHSILLFITTASKMLNPHSPNVYISTNFAKNNAIQTANSRLYEHLPKTYISNFKLHPVSSGVVFLAGSVVNTNPFKHIPKLNF